MVAREQRQTSRTANKSYRHARAYAHTRTPTDKPRPYPNWTNANVTQSADRMKNSLFGQMKRNTSNWGDSAWRRSYVDIQDAGQERAFFVKFIGETMPARFTLPLTLTLPLILTSARRSCPRPHLPAALYRPSITLSPQPSPSLTPSQPYPLKARAWTTMVAHTAPCSRRRRMRSLARF